MNCKYETGAFYDPGIPESDSKPESYRIDSIDLEDADNYQSNDSIKWQYWTIRVDHKNPMYSYNINDINKESEWNLLNGILKLAKGAKNANSRYYPIL